jgi:hypothetical protein
MYHVVISGQKTHNFCHNRITATLNNITSRGVSQEIIHGKNFLFVFKLRNNVNYVYIRPNYIAYICWNDM